MKISGVTMNSIRTIMGKMEIEVSQTFKLSSANVVQVSIRAHTSDSVYARRQYRTGYRSVNLCWHGFRDFVRAAFVEAGATRVESMVGIWTNVDEFNEDLDRIAYISVGSQFEPRYIGLDNKCECTDDLA